MSSNLYLGAMSGTSLDGLDLVLCQFSSSNQHSSSSNLEHAKCYPFPNDLKNHLFDLSHCDSVELDLLYTTEQIYSDFCASAINQFLNEHNIDKNQVSAIGIHGQTIRHRPDAPHPFTVQLADLSRIAALTEIPTIGDFRRKDIALGGQGAPLVPPFHQAVFSSNTHTRILANIGGISNITVLEPNTNAFGYDTGPGNALLDYWFSKHQNGHFDESGNWARSGAVQPELLKQLLSEPYLSQPYPKSTGRELFNPQWLDKQLRSTETQLRKQDIQTTLSEFTASSLSNEIKKHATSAEVYICGGGWRNSYLIEQLKTNLGEHFSVSSTSALGIHPDWIEACAFAWFAKNTLTKQHSNQSSATGAQRDAILGGIFYP